MLAFELFVDDERICLAGMEDWAVMSVILSAVRSGQRPDGQPREGKLDVHVGGLSEDDPDGVAHHARWARIDLATGSRVSVNVVETDHPDPPARRYRSDREIHESPFTDEEIEEMEREEWLRLKAKFEPQAGGDN
jgi:hypothetical protein